jgi:hypothetical protein
MGTLCSRIITKSELTEISIVDSPANKHARAMSFSENGKTIDSLTLQEVSSRRAQPTQL